MHRPLLLHVLVAAAALCQPASGGEGSDAGLEIHHDGVMQFDIRRMGAHAIGTSEVFHPDFTLSVRGQLRLMAAPKLVRRSEEGSASRYGASPRLVSLVAIGDITLRRSGHDEPVRAGRATYLVAERRWILDGVSLAGPESEPASADARGPAAAPEVRRFGRDREFLSEGASCAGRLRP